MSFVCELSSSHSPSSSQEPQVQEAPAVVVEQVERIKRCAVEVADYSSLNRAAEYVMAPKVHPDRPAKQPPFVRFESSTSPQSIQPVTSVKTGQRIKSPAVVVEGRPDLNRSVQFTEAPPADPNKPTQVPLSIRFESSLSPANPPPKPTTIDKARNFFKSLGK